MMPGEIFPRQSNIERNFRTRYQLQNQWIRNEFDKYFKKYSK